MKTKGIADQARKLHSALMQREIDAEIEKWDEHKHIDLSIEWARLYIEIDGDDHYTNANRIISDLKRDHYSESDGYDTVHIPNAIVDKKIDAVADALAEVARSRVTVSGINGSL